eukprot:1177526-Prorocentrum_minimum.AAC.1
MVDVKGSLKTSAGAQFISFSVHFILNSFHARRRVERRRNTHENYSRGRGERIYPQRASIAEGKREYTHSGHNHGRGERIFSQMKRGALRTYRCILCNLRDRARGGDRRNHWGDRHQTGAARLVNPPSASKRPILNRLERTVKRRYLGGSGYLVPLFAFYRRVTVYTVYTVPFVQRASDPTDDTAEASDPTDDMTEASDPTDDTAEACDPTDDTAEASDPTDDTAEASDPTDDTAEASDPTDDTAEASDLTDDTAEASDPTDDTAEAVGPGQRTEQLHCEEPLLLTAVKVVRERLRPQQVQPEQRRAYLRSRRGTFSLSLLEGYYCLRGLECIRSS